MTALLTIAILVLAIWGIMRLPAVRAWREERRRKAAEAACRVTAEAMKESGVTRERVKEALCESAGLEGVAPYFGLTPEEMAECRRARIQSRAETARQFDNLYKSIEAFRKKPENEQ
jgi:hypothetical protein